jgi:UDP-N-acetylmuramoyl-L-alanyl-D-glutamate--2,6-diaminopimelate ligase
MNLRELLADTGLRAAVPGSIADSVVEGLDYDSRRIGPNFLFFAFPGSRVDGRRFASDALKRGALAVVSEPPLPEEAGGNWIEVEHGRCALALAARRFYGNPDEQVALTGITGTNGKTTTSYLVDSILRAADMTTALIGTIEYHLAGRVLPAVNTTPESLDLVRLLADLRGYGGSHATLEVSSHALALGRVFGLRFHTAIFTNLTRDHLDFHQTMEEYFAAKRRLFEGAGAPPPKFAVINRDDPQATQIPTPEGTEALWYGLGRDAAVRACRIRSTLNGLRFEVRWGKLCLEIESPMVGRVNVYNILAACCAGFTYNLAPEAIVRGVADCRSVPGRFEKVDEGQPFAVVVDYAHTDDALRNIIAVARSLSPRRVITLFGCGGDRDRSKRPLMGQAAGELSDFVVLTSDNPRSEDPLVVINDALVGLRRSDTPHIVESDRATGIRLALNEARAGDVVILAGKGHETYQVLKDQTIHFDDREVAREVLRSFGYRKDAA